MTAVQWEMWDYSWVLNSVAAKVLKMAFEMAENLAVL
jgi:hypothetical protein